MFVPPSFEPTTPREPQWFPRPITDSIESSLDIIERLEEDRKRRIRNIANVAARTPIGLGGVEDRGHGGGSAAGSHQSPKPNSNISGGCNDYARYRYYPPLDALPSSSLVASAAASSALLETPSSLAALHNSYTLGNAERCISSSSITTRNRIYRRGATPRSTSVASTTATATTTSNKRLVAELDDDDDESVSMNIDQTVPTPHNQYLQRSGNHSFHSSSSSVQFSSPPLDPRAGGGRGGGRIIHTASSSSSSLVAAAAELTARRQHFNSQEAGINTTSDNVILSSTELITPPAMNETHPTPGEHGHGEDVYSQRRDASQRRRRRWWDEVNNN